MRFGLQASRDLELARQAQDGSDVEPITA